jgi:hypothetical protein
MAPRLTGGEEVVSTCAYRNRDHELVAYVGRQGVVTIDHVMAALGVGRTAAYRRTSACIEARLLERFEFPRVEPSLLRATRRGLRYAELALAPVVVSRGSLEHRLRCASAAQLLTAEFDPTEILSERELIAAERLRARPTFTSRLLGPRPHRPDLAVLTPERAIAVELELSPKSPRRLVALVEAWKRATWVDEVRYYCEPGATRRAVDRAIERVDAAGRVQVFEAPR